VDQPVSMIQHGSSSPSHSQDLEDSAYTTDAFKTTDNSRPFSMFTSLGKKNLFKPSATAIRTALERAKRWEAEDDSLILDDPLEKDLHITMSPRQALAAENIPPLRTGSSPTASGSANVSGHANVGCSVVDTSGAGQLEAISAFQSASSITTPTPLGNRSIQRQSGLKGSSLMKSFKSPLHKPSATRNSGNSPSTPSVLHPRASTVTKDPRSAVLDPSVTPISGAKFSTPLSVRGTPIRKSHAKKFVTPFKTGMRPGEVGHTESKARYDPERVSVASRFGTASAPSTTDQRVRPTRRRFFDLCMLLMNMCLPALLT
jgi:hypothetical protein